MNGEIKMKRKFYTITQLLTSLNNDLNLFQFGTEMNSKKKFLKLCTVTVLWRFFSFCANTERAATARDLLFCARSARAFRISINFRFCFSMDVRVCDEHFTLSATGKMNE